MIQYVIYYSIDGIPFQRNFKNEESARNEYALMLAAFNETNRRHYNYITLVEYKIMNHVSQ